MQLFAILNFNTINKHLNCLPELKMYYQLIITISINQIKLF